MASRTIGLIIAATCWICTPALGEPGHSLSAQGGWWNVEAEYRAPFGLFVDLGVPWFAMVLDGMSGGTD